MSVVARAPRSRERWVAGGVAALGVLCASATAIWPTRIEAVRAPAVGGAAQGYEHRIWSWGAEAVFASDGVRLDVYSGPTPTPSLVFLVALLVLGAAGVAMWLLLPDHRGALLGVAGTALCAAAVGRSVVARLAVDDRRLGLQPGLVVVTPVAGWLEYAAAILLAVALALMLVQQLLPAALPALAGATRRLLPSPEARQALSVGAERRSPGRPEPDQGRVTQGDAVGFSDRRVE